MPRRLLIFLLKFVVTAALVYWLFNRIDVLDSFNRIVLVDPALLGLTVIVIAIQILLNALRWFSVFFPLGGKLSYPETSRIYAIGFFFNQVLPSSIGGDAIRVHLARRAGMTLSLSVNSVILERLFDLLALLFLLAITFPVLFPLLPETVKAWAMAGATGVLLALAIGLLVLMNLHRIRGPARLSQILAVFARASDDARTLFLNPRASIRALATAVLSHLNNCAIAYVVAVALDVDVTYFQSVFLFIPVMILTTLPISIGGWGIRETSMVAMYALIGVSTESAFAISVMIGLMMIAVGLPGGALWLLSGARRHDATGE